MAKLKFSEYTLAALHELKSEIEDEISNRIAGSSAKISDRIVSLARELGLSVEVIRIDANSLEECDIGIRHKPPYQNPHDTTQTWTGRGRQPLWLKNALAQGRKLKEFRTS